MAVTLDAGAVEERLAAVWSEVLDVVPVTRSDNFFELGGDSMLVIETVALAREEGLEFTPLDLIEHQTVAELAARITRAPLARPADAAPEEFPLTAAQHRLCFGQPHPRHVTQSVLWHADGLDGAFLEAALTAVLDHHDSFRLRLAGAPGEPRLRYSAQTGVRLEHLDLSGRPTADRERELLAHTTRLQRSVDPVDGPLARAALFELGDAGRRLFVTAHHLAVDGASWRILRADLTRSYRRLRLGQPVDLPAPTSPYGLWARHLATGPGATPASPVARSARVADAASVTVRASERVTATLLGRVRSELGVGMDALLVAAVARAVARVRGPEQVGVEVEQHGRDTAPAGMDISRTTGWFTRLRTVLLTPDRLESRALITAAGRQLGDAWAGAASAVVPTVLVNYLGRFTERPEDLFTDATEAIVSDRYPDNFLSHPVEVHAVVDGARLVTVLTCDRGAPAGAGAEALAAAYREVLEETAAVLGGDDR
ncbi:condensation domain-containing protein [Kitasatospora sp. RB6PN24]|uniref:condensation domain-containing protein n=1 Tax=Kitasatospora humi TaxID=2893891 RepID=UPI001E51C9CB|nr:condensation domain-containing protein [Kitasatospora humi]MCC9308108.1 condensation domain-containing protein [Kitasatospora humi]